MMMRLILCLCLFLAPSTLLARSWYQVNLVVFEHRQGASGNEILDQPLDLRFEAPANAVVIDAIEEGGNSQGFQRTSILDQEFNGVVASLQRSSAYNVLLVKSWQQPGLERNNAVPVVLQGGRNYGRHHQLEGTVKLVLSRYLHLETDLWLGNYRQIIDTSAPPEPRENDDIVWAAVEPWEPTRLVRMQDNRRMRSKELHYLDHPLIGVIVKVIPLSAR